MIDVRRFCREYMLRAWTILAYLYVFIGDLVSSWPVVSIVHLLRWIARGEVGA